MPIVSVLADGRKLGKGTATLDNSAGAADLTQNVTVSIPELARILEVVSITNIQATINSYSVSGNTVTVNITVPAGAVGTVEVIVRGY